MLYGKAEDEVKSFYHQGSSNRSCWEDQAWEGCTCKVVSLFPLGVPVYVCMSDSGSFLDPGHDHL